MLYFSSQRCFLASSPKMQLHGYRFAALSYFERHFYWRLETKARFAWGTAGLRACVSRAELRVCFPCDGQPERSQQFGFSHSRLHCATLRAVNRLVLNTKTPVFRLGFFCIGSLAVCYSRMASATLPSPQLRFTSEFGMESGGSTALLPPGIKLVVCSLIQ